MPFKPTESTFDDASHEPITYYTEAVAEPISPATTTNGATVALFDTPQSATEVYRAPRTAGPVAARIDIALDGGGFADATAGIAVGGTVGTERSLAFRVVSLPFVSTGIDPQIWLALVACDTGEANWAG